jgi:hypothetical protein
MRPTSSDCGAKDQVLAFFEVTAFQRLIFAIFPLLLSACTGARTVHWNGISNSRLSFSDQKEEDLAGLRALEADGGGWRLKVIARDASAADAAKTVEGIEFNANTFYRKTPSPYAGVVSRESECAEEFKPKRLNETLAGANWLRGLLLFTNDRLAFGGCDPASFAFRLGNVVLYCARQGKAYEIKLYQKFADARDFAPLKETLNAFRCE